MAGEFSFGGLASGIDTQLLIQRLVAVARRPITNLQNRQRQLEDREKFFGDLGTDLGKLRDRAKSLGDVADLLAYTVSSSDATKATATASGEALATAHTLEITQLARAEREKTQGRLQEITFTFTTRVRIDRCDQCLGVWIDAHELDRILGEKVVLDNALASPTFTRAIKAFFSAKK